MLYQVVSRFAGFLLSILFGVLLGFPSSTLAQTYQSEDFGENGDGAGLSFAVRGCNRPAFSYFNDSTKALKYAELQGSFFQSEVVDASAAAVSATALVFLADVPHVFYFAGGALKHAARNGGAWSLESVAASAGGSPSAAVFGSGLVAAYYDTAHHALRVARQSGSSWIVESPDASSDDAGAASAVVSDSSGRVHVVYSDQTNKRLKYARREANGSWSVEAVAYVSEPGGLYPAIALSSDGTVHVSSSVYKTAGMPVELGVLYAKRAPTGGWTVARVPSDYAGGPTSVLVRADGYPEISARYVRVSAVYGNSVMVRLARLEQSGLWQTLEYSRVDGAATGAYTFDRIASQSDPWGNVMTAYRVVRSDPQATVIHIDRPLDSDSNTVPDGFLSANADQTLFPASCDQSSTQSNAVPGILSGATVYPPSSDNPVTSTPTPTPTPAPSDTPVPTVTPVPQIGDDPSAGATDSDGDGVTDAQELLDGTNPYDRGSSSTALGTDTCVRWGKSYGENSTVFEAENRSDAQRSAVIALYDARGRQIGTRSCAAAANAQCRVALDDLVKKSGTAYGSVCLKYSGVAGDFTGRVVQMKSVKGATEFAVADELANAVTRLQAVSYDTTPESRLAAQSKLQTVNFFEVLNLSGRAAAGTLEVYSNSGQLVNALPVVLSSRARTEVSASRLGVRGYGVALWRPAENDTRFQFRAARYVCHQEKSGRVCDAVVRTNGAIGSGEQLAAPADTTLGSPVLELSNASDTANMVSVQLRNSGGDVIALSSLEVAAHATEQFDLTRYLGTNRAGSVVVRGSVAEGLVAQVVSYRRNKDGSVQYGYAVAARQAIGSVLLGTYDAAANQESRLVVVNAGSSAESAALSMVQSPAAAVSAKGALTVRSGKRLLNGRVLSVAARGSLAMNLSPADRSHGSGVVELQAADTNVLTAWILRKRSSNFVVVTPVRE